MLLDSDVRVAVVADGVVAAVVQAQAPVHHLRVAAIASLKRVTLKGPRICAALWFG
jgi:hypothetical protein